MHCKPVSRGGKSILGVSVSVLKLHWAAFRRDLSKNSAFMGLNQNGTDFPVLGRAAPRTSVEITKGLVQPRYIAAREA
jgi:hypothetical protein